jgi:hypothetical protein
MPAKRSPPRKVPPSKPTQANKQMPKKGERQENVRGRDQSGIPQPEGKQTPPA